MSKYTTQVRYICETDAGLTETVGASMVDEVLNKSWMKTFTSSIEFWDENYREFLCKKIMKHYYLREIGCETVGIWKLWMNTKLEEIMPYYNQLYESVQMRFDPFHDVDLTTSGNRNDKEVRNDTGNSTGSSTRTGNDTRDTNNSDTSRNLYSDTPQGALTGVESETYLTNASKNMGEGTSHSEGSSGETSETKNEYTDNGTKDVTGVFTETVKGKRGNSSYSKMLSEYRETMINIDMRVISEFEEMFMMLW